ncbi:MAG: hypothetical protein DRP49_03355, partial [Spirochaetes bacterium]
MPETRRFGLLSALSFLILFTSCSNPSYFRVYSGDTVGFVNSKGKSVIPSVYQDAEDFSEGLALVVIDGKGGWIDRRGQLVIPADFPIAAKFHQGRAMAVAEEEGSAGYLDSRGNWAIEPQWLKAGDFSQGLAAVEDAEGAAYINRKGREAFRHEYDFSGPFSQGRALVVKDGKYG